MAGILTMDKSSSNNLHVVLLSSPEAGHVVPILALADRLADQHGVRSTVLLVNTGASSEAKQVKLPKGKGLVEIIWLPPVDISNLVDHSTKMVTKLYLMMREAVPLVRSAIASMEPRPDALVVVFFGTEYLRLAAELNMAKYVFFTTTAWFLALTVYCPVLDEEIKGRYVDEPGHLKIPGCRPVGPEDMVDMMLDRDDETYHEYLRMAKGLALPSDGILVNTWEDLEPKTLQAFRENEAMKSILKSPVYPIGPLRKPVEPTGLENVELADWLDKQPNQSVLFVSFGGGGVLSAEQTTELAWGLELSQQRFVWVIRPPKRGHVNDVLFPDNIEGAEDVYLPGGFLHRTKNTGILLPKWGQQVEILAHPSVGGFMSHCGWNSTLESITSGVPMIAWPLYAEQKMNAAFLVEELGVAVRPEVLPTKKVVGREEIEKMVRTLMEHKDGQAMRDRAKQLKASAANGLSQGGSSHQFLCKILSDIEAQRKSITLA